MTKGSTDLISTEIDVSNPRDTPDLQARIEITEHVPKIQQALGISIRELAHTDPAASMRVSPVFRIPHEWHPPYIPPDVELLDGTYQYDLFVLMPFEPVLRPVYDDHIKAVAERLDLSIARADDFFGTEPIIQEIWSAIVHSRALLADCTGKNPNVFYEMGIAHTLGKPVVLITQNQEDVPFDLRHRRYIHYEYTPRGMREFEFRLRRTLENLP